MRIVHSCFYLLFLVMFLCGKQFIRCDVTSDGDGLLENILRNGARIAFATLVRFGGIVNSVLRSANSRSCDWPHESKG